MSDTLRQQLCGELPGQTYPPCAWCEDGWALSGANTPDHWCRICLRGYRAGYSRDDGEPVKKYRPLICLDWDGVIHSYDSGWQGAHRCDDGPVPGAMQWLFDVYEADTADVAIYSSRSKWPWGRWAMKSALRRWLFAEFQYMAGPRHLDPVYDEICRWVKWPWFKPAAFISIDDRAVTFEGTWPVVADLLTFKPWNKKPRAAE